MADKPGSWSSKLRAHISNLTNRKQKELTRNGTWLWNLNCHLPWHTFSVLNLDLLNCPNSYTNWEPSIRILKTTGHISFKPPHPFNGISRVDVTNPQSNTSWGSNLPLLLDSPVEALTPFGWQQASQPGSVVLSAAGVWPQMEHGHTVLELLRRMCLANVKPMWNVKCQL